MADKPDSIYKDSMHLPYGSSSVKKSDKNNQVSEPPEQMQFMPDLETVFDVGEVPADANVIEVANNMQVNGENYPPRYNKVIPIIAKITEAGLVCFLNPESLELEQVSGKMLDNPEAFYASSGGSAGQKPFQHLLWNDCVMFEPVPEKELLHLVEDFMQYLAGDTFHDKLARLMMKGKPYKKLDVLICKSQHAAFWDQYKTKRLKNLVKDKLAYQYTYHPEQFKQKE